MAAIASENKQADTVANVGEKFILKLHFKIRIPKYLCRQFYSDRITQLINMAKGMPADIFKSIENEPTQLCKWICNSVENAMFSFKITFHANPDNWKRWDLIVKKFESLCHVGDNPFFKPTYSGADSNINISPTNGLTVFHSSIKQYYIPNNDYEIVFAMILNKSGTSTGVGGSINGYCEPRFEYPCHYCATHQWLESPLIDQHGCKTIIYRLIK